MKNPKVTSAIFCDAASKGELGKYDCRGVFTSIYGWSFPTSIRNWFSIATVYGLPRGTSFLTASISRGKGKSKKLARTEINIKTEEDFGTIIPFPLIYRFEKPGFHYITFQIEDSDTRLRVPLSVVEKEWPKFSEREIEQLRKTPNLVRSVRANIVCAGCSRPYTFEEAILQDHSYAGGVTKFPESGTFVCESCGHELLLRDIQGQIRDSIKTAIQASMRGT